MKNSSDKYENVTHKKINKLSMMTESPVCIIRKVKKRNNKIIVLLRKTKKIDIFGVKLTHKVSFSFNILKSDSVYITMRNELGLHIRNICKRFIIVRGENEWNNSSFSFLYTIFMTLVNGLLC